MVQMARKAQAEASKQALEAAKTHHEMVAADELPKMRHEEALARLQQAADAAEQRSQDLRYSVDARAESAQQALQLKALIAGQKNSQGNVKLKPGERFNANGDVEAIPGSDLYVNQSIKHGNAYKGVLAIDSKTDNAVAKLDKILAPENSSGFNGNFGGYNAYVTQYIPGQTQSVKRELESLQSDLASTGLDIMRAGGGIGQMTEREWPIVRGMIAQITPNMSESDARAKLTEIRNYMLRIKGNAHDVYKNEWGNTNFYKPSADAPPPPSGGTPAKPMGKSGPVSAPGAVLKFDAQGNPL
jgi:hypothetical protein